MKQIFFVIILIVCFFIIAFASTTLVFHAIKIIERQELEEKILNAEIIDMDETINRAIAHCENNGLGCHKSIPKLLEQCQDENMSRYCSMP